MNKNILTNEQLNRIVSLGHQVWSSLSEDERENYRACDGTVEFVDDIRRLLNLHEIHGYDFESVDVFNQVHDDIIYGTPEQRKVYGIYAPDHDITFVMEECFTNGEPVSLEVKGFYFGEPTECDIETFYGDLKADFR